MSGNRDEVHSVAVAPKIGKANDAVRSLLAAAMNTAASNLDLRGGAASRDKVFVYNGPA